MTQKKPTTQKTAVASFRLRKEAHDRLYENAAKAGLSTRDWLEQAILENKTTIIERKKPNTDVLALVFQVNKAGNNINQIAHHLNTAAKQSTISKDQYDEAIDKIDHLRILLNEAVRYVS